MKQLEAILSKIPYYTKANYFIDCMTCISRALVNNIIHKPVAWFKYRFIPRHRYHIINLCKSGNGYKHGWYDTDTRMLHACFLLLVEYVELESPFKHIDWGHNENSKAVAQEIKDLYDWWKVRRPAAKKELAIAWRNEPSEMRFEPAEGGGFTIFEPSSVTALIKKERELEAIDQQNLERLIKIRKHLWT